MTHIIAVLLILALHLPGQTANTLTCQVRQHRTGPVCWCKAQRPGSRWQTYPMIVCQIVNQ